MPEKNSDIHRLISSCMQCILRSALSKMPEELPEEEKTEYLQRVFALLAKADPTLSPSEVSHGIRAIQRDYFVDHTDFPSIKRYYNQKLMDRAEEIRAAIGAAKDPLLAAVRYAISGNYIDFGMPDAVAEEKLEEVLASANGIAISDEIACALRSDIEAASTIVVLHDNCGEIVLDKLLIEEIRAISPEARVISVVRGAEVRNDVSVVDAKETGLDEIAEILPNGDEIAGTVMERISEETRAALRNADVILSKGQGNFETFRGCGLNVYYLFLCKCDLFSNLFSVPRYTGMVVREEEAGRL